MSDYERSSTARVIPPARPRKLAKVPFVELADGRLQGVVSSGSAIERVYVSSVAAGTYAYACSTNNNRPCGGARGGFCNHIGALISEAVVQYGAERVARYLRADLGDGEASAQTINAGMSATRPSPADSKAAASVFSRFLRHLTYLELPPTTAPLPEMQWFPATRAQSTEVPPQEAGAGEEECLDTLTEPVDGLTEALTAVDAFDRALTGGLLRPRPAQAEGLIALADAVAASPLAARAAEAAEKAAAGAASEDHFVTLAAARTALLGAAHDALTARADEVTGRAREEATVPPAAGGQAQNLLAAARSWLCDLARTGWQGIDHDVVSGAAQVVSAMLPEPRLRRLAALLDGFAAELAASCPGAALERIPVRRWADLWARGMLLTLPGAAAAPAAYTATGRLLPLGVDVHEHATAVQAQVHAVFEPADGTAARLVRASVSVPKPDTVLGAGVWQLLRPHMTLLAAAGEGRSMDLTEMPVTAEGDLIWQDEHARPGEPADPFATARVALPTATTTSAAPLDRHPARLAEPVFLEGYGIDRDGDTVTFTLPTHRLPVDTDRVPAAGPLTPQSVAASSACIGLLRWDAGRFRLQPLAVETTVRRKPVAVHAGAWAGGTTDKAGAKAEKAATDAVNVLRERAGRLLRK
ncbi:hypothetical protein Srubr_28010 [Streptomyces rubradiris]|uniref:SWIM-type domain-containing protein n=1 Tax=Streptomyces rubradiris TaxID=285531 RepID=A0ABQ3RAT1_STRRR|nr:hypothetical protein GCM10018792_50890 [Streptomyces rubradiris]GHI52955.1 hypothetical protein Srubr_28010 [Streptomyces rubradiris]